MKIIWPIACDKALLIRAIKIAIVVGFVLNIINQGELIFGFELGKINFFKFGLTFIVPFCVSMYTAISMKIKFHIGDKAVANATLKCKTCKEELDIKENEIIPFCKNCNEKTLWKIKRIKGKECQL